MQNAGSADGVCKGLSTGFYYTNKGPSVNSLLSQLCHEIVSGFSMLSVAIVRRRVKLPCGFLDAFFQMDRDDLPFPHATPAIKYAQRSAESSAKEKARSHSALESRLFNELSASLQPARS